jgi:hypothetical protein
MLKAMYSCQLAGFLHSKPMLKLVIWKVQSNYVTQKFEGEHKLMAESCEIVTSYRDCMMKVQKS